MTSDSNRTNRCVMGFGLLFLTAVPLREAGPATALWATPCLLVSALLIAWAAESAQFFIAQGFALAILAWLQTLPEFAVEAVLAWKQQNVYLMANLTGALRILTGFGWPMIYFIAAFNHRRKSGGRLRRIELDRHHSIEVLGLILPILYGLVIWGKSSLHVFDAIVLIALYIVYLVILTRLPPQDKEGIDDLESIPRAIVLSPKPRRIALITLLFVGGGILIYITAEPFLSSLMAVAVLIGIPSFVFIQWVAPLVSEFPEMASTFYWARTVTRSPMALMNMVSSNINQWTLLPAMLPIVYSISKGSISGIPLDDEQKLELLMTIGQALIGWLFLVNMQLAWWEATVLFTLWIVQFSFSAVSPTNPVFGGIASHMRWYITVAYFGWAALELVRVLLGHRKPAAFTEFAKVWHEHVT